MISDFPGNGFVVWEETEQKGTFLLSYSKGEKITHTRIVQSNVVCKSKAKNPGRKHSNTTYKLESSSNQYTSIASLVEHTRELHNVLPIDAKPKGSRALAFWKMGVKIRQTWYLSCDC